MQTHIHLASLEAAVPAHRPHIARAQGAGGLPGLPALCRRPPPCVARRRDHLPAPRLGGEHRPAPSPPSRRPAMCIRAGKAGRHPRADVPFLLIVPASAALRRARMHSPLGDLMTANRSRRIARRFAAYRPDPAAARRLRGGSGFPEAGGRPMSAAYTAQPLAAHRSHPRRCRRRRRKASRRAPTSPPTGGPCSIPSRSTT